MRGKCDVYTPSLQQVNERQSVSCFLHHEPAVISSISSGSSWSMPLRMMEWVCPPQTSIMAHGRVVMARISSKEPLGQDRIAEFIQIFHG